jgi:maleylacetoacetate isomerase
MLQLYSYYRSPSSYRVRAALCYKGLEYAYHGVHLVRNGGEQYAPEYKKLNPQGLVPTLIDGETILTQSMAIMEYLEEKHPEPRILPKKAAERAFVRQLAMITVADIQPLTSLRVYNYLSGELGISQAQKTAWHHQWIRQGFDAIEKLLEKSPYRTGLYCCGDHVTIADICLVAQVYDARRYEIQMSSWPLIEEIEKNCLKLASFQTASPENQPDTPEDQRLAVLKGRS